MKTKVFQPTRLVLAVSAALSLGALTSNAGAVEFQFKDGDVTGRFDTQLSVGTLWRTEGRDADMAANEDPVAMAAKGYSTQLNKNDAENNFDVGMASLVYKITPELAVNFNGQWGAFVRATAFYDSVIMNDGHDGGQLLFGNGACPGGGNPSSPCPDFGINRYASYSDHANNGTGSKFTDAAEDNAGQRIRLLDAYVWTDVDLFGRTLGVRAGRQVITWGESLFIQNGVNTANYVDLAALRLPGAELKEALLPLASLSFSYGLTDNLSMEAFYQFEWQNTEDAPAGTYYSTHDAFPGEGAENVIVDGRLVALSNGVPALADVFANYTLSQYGQSGVDYEYEQTQVTVDRLADEDPSDDGQFGLAFRYFADQLNGTEFGFYYSQLHARLPVVGSRVDQLGVGSIAERIDNARYFMVYPEAIDMYGMSFNTTVGMFSLAGELAYRPAQPIINEVGDNLISSLAGVAASGAPVISDLTDHCVRSEVGGSCLDGNTAIQQGDNYYFYDEAETVTGSLLSIMSLGPTLGTDNLVGILELGVDSTHGLNDKLRYNSTAALLDSEAIAHNPDDPNSVYLTQTAWGYRAIVKADYNDIFAGVIMSPSVRLSHDVSGNSPIGGNFLEGRKAATLGVDFVYLNNLGVGVQATSFWGGGYSNKLKDRNNASLSVSYSF
ncbi:MAG: DUF1302 domain-containing protein [Alcanivoracaceae bacterium]|nr:DUF1302 domain-containing protein [Alcanivoracaceae bacterium]